MPLARILPRILARIFACLCLILSVLAHPALAAADQEIKGPWRSILFENGMAEQAFQAPDLADGAWSSVEVPHNWQGYAYARQVVKGSRHGTAWYRKALTIPARATGDHVYLMFEGVNAYATVWLNGKSVGHHAGGLTSFTLDVTQAVRKGQNLLAVRVDNPAGIRDLPWVSGDDSPENGFAEGSQPFGIFRPVHVITGSPLRFQPFGLYAWGDKGAINADSARLMVRSELENHSPASRRFQLVEELVDKAGHVVAARRSEHTLAAGAQKRVQGALSEIIRPHLWSPDNPYLYTLRARLLEGEKIINETSTPYGIRTVEIATNTDGTRQLRLNGEPLFLHGIAEYEHQLGDSHAFSLEQIKARISQVKAGGFNAFRDAHYPHNLRYGGEVEREGLMWWPQFSAHIWFDNPDFRANFLSLLGDWVRERRNNPANFMWGLQNESTLPEDFVAQAMAVIRDLDPTASVDRLIVTCNGGKGSDWNVPQNWSGTYGGDPETYADELRKQGLVGEYGAWRSLGAHQEAPFKPSTYDESTMTAILETKSRLALSLKGKQNQAIGDFAWLLTTHENPGRPMRIDGTQIFDGIRPLEHTGPANNKGLMTLWGEPLDAYYMLRAQTVSAHETPMVYIVSHTWPDRWITPGTKSGIEVFSNCDAVELFNDVTGKLSLGRKTRTDARSFVWNDVDIRFNTLSATCYVGNKASARDVILLNNLPSSPDAMASVHDRADITQAEAGADYLYRVNAGGPTVKDADGQIWQGDRHLTSGATWGWRSWADDYPDLDPALGSRRVSYDPVEGTSEQALFQTYRFGRDRLSYSFAAPPGDYQVELYFSEPWYGRTGINAKGWRLFDVALNGKTVLKDVDIFAEAGFSHAVKKVITTSSVDGHIVLSFPRIKSGQAVISAIAIRRSGEGAAIALSQGTDLIDSSSARSFLDNGDALSDAAHWSQLPPVLLDSDWLAPTPQETSIAIRQEVDAWLALPMDAPTPQGWSLTDLTALVIEGEHAHKLHFVKQRVAVDAQLVAPANAALLVTRRLPSPYAPGVFSLKKTTGLYEAEAGVLQNAVVATAIKGYGGGGYVAFAKDGEISWSIKNGAAAILGFKLRYVGCGAEPGTGHLTLTDESLIRVADINVSFVAGEKGAWSEIDIMTPTLVNAGTYKLTLSANEGLCVDSLRVQ